MATDHFIPRDFSLRETDLIPPDEAEDISDEEYRQYCQEAKHVDTDDVMVMVGDAFSTSDLLRSLVEEVKRAPFAPGERRHFHVSDNTAMGNLVATLIDQAQADLVGMHSAGREGR